MTSPRALLTAATAQLAAAGVASPRVDAELLLAHCLDVPRARLMLSGEAPPDVVDRFEALVARRERREPLQYIVGEAAFRHVVLAVGEGVFIPRPETELLVDAVLPALLATASPLAVDLCAGSGALAISIAGEVVGASVWAVERSAAALAWLDRNAANSGVHVVAADIREPTLLAALRGSVDAVVSNPPYVAASAPVAPEVRADPPEAVFAGADGLDLIPTVIARAAELLRPGGVLALEHGDDQGDAVPARLATDGRWLDISAHADLAGRPRFAVARRR